MGAPRRLPSLLAAGFDASNLFGQQSAYTVGAFAGPHLVEGAAANGAETVLGEELGGEHVLSNLGGGIQ